MVLYDSSSLCFYQFLSRDAFILDWSAHCFSTHNFSFLQTPGAVSKLLFHKDLPFPFWEVASDPPQCKANYIPFLGLFLILSLPYPS